MSVSGGTLSPVVKFLFYAAGVIVVSALILTGIWFGFFKNAHDSQDALPSDGTATAVEPPKTYDPPEMLPDFDKTKYSIDDPDSIWVVVNKQRSFNPIDWKPSDLTNADVSYSNLNQFREEAARSLEKMFAAYKKETGGTLHAQSNYRSYITQKNLYNSYLKTKGREWTDKSSARPGHSEHQSGLTSDIAGKGEGCIIQECFKDTRAGKWLAANSWEYGFILRYPEGMSDITGFKFEPWHYRYVGVELATEMHKQEIATLEEFFNLGPAPNYLD